MKQLLCILGAATLMVALLATSSAAAHAQDSDQMAVVGARGAHLYATEQAAVQDNRTNASSVLAPGSLLMIQGRSSDSRFLYVQAGDGLAEEHPAGWVAVQLLLVVNVNSLPIIDADPTAADGTVAATAYSITDTATLASAASADNPLSAVTLLATPTPHAAADQTSAPGTPITASVTLTNSRLNLRLGPAISYPIVARAEPGSRWRVIGQTKAGDWLQLRSVTSDELGWAAMRYLALEGNGALPVITEFPRILVAEATATPVPDAEAAGSSDSRILLPTPAAGGGERSVVAQPTAGKTGLSGTLAFQDHNGGTIYLYDLNNDRLIPLTNGIDPAISPDGQRIAFTRDGGAGGLYVINRDGSGEARIYNDHPLLRAPSWSPDGQWIVFSRANGFEDCRVVRGSVCLPDEAIIESLPESLQDDAEVHNLVKGIPNQRTYHTSLARIAPDGTGYRDIPALDYAAAPDWNAAGIVYQSNAGIQRTADEADVRSVEVANDPLVGYFHDPDWQPTTDGAWGRIVFHRKQGSHWQIYAVNPDGSGLTALTRPVTALVDELPSNVSPAWSPDGQQIIYLSNRNSIESAGAWHLWVMNADGSEQRMLPIDVVFDYTFSSEQMVSWTE
ncbi:MAG TPA: SH3 domain-containing protein [Caldilineaceae bacterium]|nr:SH3 domain-containing protein [Caldilineaceae bacterium]